MKIKYTTHKEMIKDKGNIAAMYLDELLALQNSKCGNCNKYLVLPRKNNFVIHHKDRDRENNDISNLILLCIPCHKKEHKVYWDTKLKLRTGYSFVELKSLGISYLQGVYKWDEIKSNPRAVYIHNGLGRIKNLPCKKTYGYSQAEIGNFFGLTHQSIQQLQSRGSIRFYTMIAIMNHPLMKELCHLPLTDAG